VKEVNPTSLEPPLLLWPDSSPRLLPGDVVTRSNTQRLLVVSSAITGSSAPLIRIPLGPVATNTPQELTPKPPAPYGWYRAFEKQRNRK
jgi:hypothetical protein